MKKRNGKERARQERRRAKAERRAKRAKLTVRSELRRNKQAKAKWLVAGLLDFLYQRGKVLTLGIWFWPAIIVILATGTGLLMYSDSRSLLRPVMALCFLLVCPGMSLMRLLHIHDSLTELTLAIALSMAIDAIVAAIMLYSASWSPQRSLNVLIGISIGGALLQVIMAYITPATSVTSEGIVQKGYE